MSEELKPCPHDGISTPWASNGHRLSIGTVSNTNGNIRYVTCLCGARGPWASSKDVAIERWNTRPTEQQQAARIAELNRTLSIEEARSNELTDRLKLYSQEIATRQEMPPLRDRVKELLDNRDEFVRKIACAREARRNAEADRDRFKAEAERLNDRLIEACRDGSASAAKLSDIQAVAKELAEALGSMLEHRGMMSHEGVKMSAEALAKHHAL